MRYRLILLVALLATWGPRSAAHAQSPITATADRTSLSTDETLMLTVAVETDQQDVTPALPSFEGFDVVGTSTGREIVFSGGAVNVKSTYSFQLRPTMAGTLTIPAVSVTIDGQTYTTEPIPITVAQGQGLGAPSPPPGSLPPGSLAPPGAPPGGLPGAPGEIGPDAQGTAPAFVTAEVDNPKPFIGEKLLYTFRLYRDQSLRLRGQPRYIEPPFTGFWNKYQPEQTHQVVRIGERLYDVAELRTALFPTTPGPATIGPASLVLPGGFMRGRTQLETEPVALEVQPLPEGAPAGFDGAVGQYRIDAAVDSPTGRVDEPIRLDVTIAGEGNLDALPDPAWPDPPPGWKAFAGRTTANTQAENGTVRGTRRYERLLVPGQAGEAILAPIPYVYFDPRTGRYETISTQPIQVSIAPGGAGGAQARSGSGAASAGSSDADNGGADARNGAAAPASDIGPLLPLAASQPRIGALVDQPAGLVLLWLFPLGLLAGDVAWRRWRVRRAARRPPPAAPHHQARASLAQARQPGADACALVERALFESAALRLAEPAQGLTRRALVQRLTDAGVDPALVARMDATLGTCENARFGPGGGAGGQGDDGSKTDTAALVAEAEEIVAALERSGAA